ncbi:hypothetical protein OVY01_08315 [Robbsia sp. Bb-Pol-6]|uniref:F-box domain-containing protein n=1 Tax=Robbsia betulipollinis TaxID=2981849 RepID=A0ABT3ZL14_9BURK|nr:hypothetical protein [Robbsia betulipollinis]MCY0387236.1 hypothetical protein [Robbsia betulipollinis]
MKSTYDVTSAPHPDREGFAPIPRQSEARSDHGAETSTIRRRDGRDGETFPERIDAIRNAHPGTQTLNTSAAERNGTFAADLRGVLVSSSNHRYGRRYGLDGTGTPASMPRTTRHRLQTILEQGLSGRRDLSAGAAMARAPRPDLRQNTVSLPPPPPPPPPPRDSSEASSAPVHGDATEVAGLRMRETREPGASEHRGSFISSSVMLLDLPQEDLDAIAERADAGSLVALYDVNRRMRDTVESVLRRKWPIERRERETVRAALADEAKIIRFFADHGFKIDDVMINGRTLLAESLHHDLSRDTYAVLLDMTTELNGRIIKEPSDLLPDFLLDRPILEAAIRYRNKHAVEAIVTCVRHAIPSQKCDEPGYVALAAEYNDLDTMRYLIESGKFSVNDRRFGFTALQTQLADLSGDGVDVVRYLLSRDDIALDDPSLVNDVFPKNPGRFALLVEDPRIDINAVEYYDTVHHVAHTPLTAAIYTMCTLADNRNFDVLIQCERVDVSKPILCADDRWRTPEQYLRHCHQNNTRDVHDRISVALRRHPRYVNRRAAIAPSHSGNASAGETGGSR